MPVKKVLCGIFLFVAVAYLTGCGTVKTMNRAEWRAETTRIFPNNSPDAVLAASEEVFKLSDGGDFSFAYTDDELIATRRWMFYTGLANFDGTDTWRVKATRGPNGATKATVIVYRSSSDQTMVLTTPTPSYATTGTGGLPVSTPWDYRLFWLRMEFLLGNSSEWLDCKAASEKFSKEAPTEDTRVTTLCQFATVDDKPPNGSSVKSK